MFHELAPVYDEIYSTKDYRAEAGRLEDLVRRFGPARPRSWLDVACGTGRHLAFLRRRFEVAGVDASPEMLRLARRRLPGVPLALGDMRSFRLDRSFDVVTCLFSAIGHLTSEAEVARTFANFARHLNPGGVALVEPWIDPAEYRSGHLHLVTQATEGRVIVRLAYSRRRGNRSLVRYEYLVGDRGRGIRHWGETDVGLLVPRRRLVDLMGRAGLKARLVTRGLTTARGLVVGRKLDARARPDHLPS